MREAKTKCSALTDDSNRATFTPRFRSSHQKNAPTSPAAPVPDAKYLVWSKSFRQNVRLAHLEEHMPDVVSCNDRGIGAGELHEGEPAET